ncbi:hypothetical protein M885DRAFT_501862 [Pelagophyceae sp. CCMP2097]|nr:hypothetical protein M885DRAFT_501862 [Pelagophyceae sp. CCMP2097]
MDVVDLDAASVFWVGFDLDGRRAELDARALDIADGREASSDRRRGLSENTERFREELAPDRLDGKATSTLEALLGDGHERWTAEERRAARAAVEALGSTKAESWVRVCETLKLYQDEVDALTRRCRGSDGAFLALYRSLSAAPDPARALKAGAKAGARAKSEAANAAKLAAELRAYDAEFAALKDQQATVRRLEDALRDAARSAEASAEARAAERAGDAERDADARVGAARDREKALERKVAAQAVEVPFCPHERLVTVDLRADAAESMLFAEREAATPRGTGDGGAAVADLVERASAAEREAAALRALMEKRGAGRTASAAFAAGGAAEARPGAESREALLTADVADLEAALAEARGAAKKGDAARRGAEAQLAAAVAEQHRLADVARRAESPAALQKDVAQLRKKLAAAEARASDAPVAPAGDAFPERTGAESHGAAREQLEAERLALHQARAQIQALSDQLDVQQADLGLARQQLAARDGRAAAAGPSDGGLAAALSGAAEPPLLEVVVAQRDRFRRRAAELETEAQEARHRRLRDGDALQAAKRDAAQLSDQLRAARSSKGSADEDPFSQLERHDRHRPQKHLSKVERFLLGLLRTVVANPRTRAALFLYAAALHLLVFATTLYHSHRPPCAPPLLLRAAAM